MSEEFADVSVPPSRTAVLIEQAQLAAVLADHSDEHAEIEIARLVARSPFRDAPAQFSEAETLFAVLRGARRLADTLDRIEKTAARMARERGVTVAELARVAQISERAAMTRYRRRGDAPAEDLLTLAIEARRAARLDPNDVLFALNARADRVLCGLSTSDQATDPERVQLADEVTRALQFVGLRLEYAPGEPGRYHDQDPADILAAGGLVEIVQDVELLIALDKHGRYDDFTTPPEILAALAAAVAEPNDDDEDQDDEPDAEPQH
ncbi:hypothetical protein [Actinomadura mexicana]|uniref:Uncharacterized protein n=1 Tax=Actinomadura mexicana TaxID=134959 RepID=A0A239HI70_9ACTN|nr:hypothetical protein [Actinomadura mexicana]SNS80855.1 hypothetical protein SAMN06265355_13135 [Actinomadura mexicana]